MQAADMPGRKTAPEAARRRLPSAPRWKASRGSAPKQMGAYTLAMVWRPGCRKRSILKRLPPLSSAEKMGRASNALLSHSSPSLTRQP